MRVFGTHVFVTAVLALGLAACGGGGSSNQANVGGGGGGGGNGGGGSDVCAMPSQACVDAAQATLTAAQSELAALLADPKSTQAQITAARAAVTAAQTALTTAQTALATYNAKQPPTYDVTAMAKAIGTPATLGGGVVANNASTNTVAGGKVTVEEGTPLANTYSEATWPVPAISGWKGSVWERTTPTKDSVVVYTNIEAAKPAKYNTYYAAGSAAPTNADSGWTYKAWGDSVASVAAQQDGQGNNDLTKPTIITLAASVTKATRSLFDFAHGLTGPNQTNAFVDDADTDDVDESKPKIKGTFNGVAGTFACDSGCDVRSDKDGKLATFTGTWTFTATSKDAMVAGALMDADYLDFGYWVQTTTADGTTSYAANTFARGQDLYENVSFLEGKATYTGGAAGLYTKRAQSAKGDGDVVAVGRFTADAEVTAYFAGSSVAVNDVYSISGRIDNFMDGGKMIDAGWSLDLNRVQKANEGDGVSASGTWTDIPDLTDGDSTNDVHFLGTTNGGGTWSGNFYGDDTTGNDGTTPLPTGVAGRFTGTFNNGHVIGAFGATKTTR